MASSDRRTIGDRAGRWLREQRERRGISSQAELARLLGWDKSAVNNYETRGVSVPDERAKQLADFFRLDIIEVRRNLGLWVPDEAAPSRPLGPDVASMTADEMLQHITEQLIRYYRRTGSAADADAHQVLRGIRGESA